MEWCEDRQRCREASIPESVSFRTKPELALQMLERLFQAQLPLAWVVAETVYGGNGDLRTWLEAHQYPYVLAVACTEPVEFQAPQGRRRAEAALVEACMLSDHQWQRLAMSEGTKGPRLFDWAVVPMLHQWQDDGRHFLLIRRSLADPQEKSYSFVFAPPGTTLPEMVQATGAGFHVEEDFENGKDLGLDHYEVRSAPSLVSPHHPGDAGPCAPLSHLCHHSSLPGGSCWRVVPGHAVAADHPGSASPLGAAHLACPGQHETRAGLVLVAALPPTSRQFFPSQTSFESWLSLAWCSPVPVSRTSRKFPGTAALPGNFLECCSWLYPKF